MKRFLRAWWAWAADVVDDLLSEPVPRREPNKVDLAMKVERTLVARYLRERAQAIRTGVAYGDSGNPAPAGGYRDITASVLEMEANRIAGGMHHR